MTRDARHRLFVRWSCHTLDDERLDVVSILARHVFDRALLQVRRAGADGVLTHRQVMDGLRDADGLAMAPLWPGGPPVDSVQAIAAIAELVAIGLLEDHETPGRYVLAGWWKHNGQPHGTDGKTVETVEDRADRVQTAQRAAAHRTNHRRGYHDDKTVDDCELCQAATVEDGTDDRYRTDTDGLNRTDQNRPQQQRDRTVPEPLDASEVQATTIAIGHALGIPPDRTRDVIPGAVMAGQANGWSIDAMVELAGEAAIKADNPRAYWLAIIQRPAPDRPLRTADDFARFFAEHDQDQDDAA